MNNASIDHGLNELVEIQIRELGDCGGRTQGG